MTSNCQICQKECIFKRRPNAKEGTFGTSFDRFQTFLCKECANISTTEADALTIQNRNIIFFCASCKSGIAEKDSIIKVLENLTKKQKLEIINRDMIHEKKDLDDRHIIETLNEDIEQLQYDLKLKENHIKRLERGSQILTDEAEAVEESYHQKTSQLSQTIEDLRAKLSKTDKVKLDIEKMTRSHKNELQNKTQQINELIKQNHALIERINSLEKQNNELELSVDTLKQNATCFANNQTLPPHRNSNSTQNVPLPESTIAANGCGDKKKKTYTLR
ncbi:unnamed protein product [Ceutorhynchus assimilis]|uniref:Uncharacterized protein n=1 Tax=Ceutorhynchus assimilis TaxID=467358 RepID=A0A9N9MNR4_9CUCU|nr:unnamed protein product [Ceutorhynchus assimilis]